MSIDTYHQLKASDDAAAQQYLGNNFATLFKESTELFATYGWSAIVFALLVALFAWGTWWRFRNKLPWRWGWLIPVLGFSAYAGIKASVIAQLIERAAELPQMWELYFRYWMPVKMMRTSVAGLLLTTVIMWIWVWRKRQNQRE